MINLYTAAQRFSEPARRRIGTGQRLPGAAT